MESKSKITIPIDDVVAHSTENVRHQWLPIKMGPYLQKVPATRLFGRELEWHLISQTFSNFFFVLPSQIL
jgi:hypothetical protein